MISDESIHVFANRADGFCALVDSALQMSPESFLHEVHRRLPVLYASALALPDVTTFVDDAKDHDESDANDVELDLGNSPRTRPEPELESTSEFMTRMRALTTHLGPRARYREVFAPYSAESETPVTGNLADDILSIARDLRRGLLPWRRGEIDVAAWRWQLHFGTHWGEHATGALRALHALAFDHDLGPPPRREDA
ncbi:DUF5063 domain-containing protein [Gemmatimonas aurantiaca]|uniref:DUF5063 domain-containing protein n=1 Tax=Gemmatimonas aurantiaca TaxID=173480 RepID=UPI00301E0ABD